MSTSIPYVYQYQRNVMFETGTSVQRPDFVNTNNTASTQNALSPNQALGFPSSLVNAPLNTQPLTTPLLGLPLLPQTSSLGPSTNASSLRSLTASSLTAPETANPIQAKLAALQPPALTPQQIVTGPFANADKALSEKLAANRGVEIVKAETQSLPKTQIIPPTPPRVEDRTLQMPPMAQNTATNANTPSSMFGMLARLHEMFSPQVRNPTEGQGGQTGTMNMGGSASGGEGHHGSNPQRRQQTTARFSAMA